MKKLLTAALMGGAIIASACGTAGMASAGEYSTCGEAAQDGVFNILEDDPNYWDEGDRDGDGVACEKN